MSYNKSSTYKKQTEEVDENKRLLEVEERKKINQSMVDHPICLDDESTFNLPPKQKVSASTIFHSQRTDIYEGNSEIKDLVSKIDSVLENHLYTWDNVGSWSFNLPNTMFSGNETPIQFFQPQPKLSTQQMKKLTADHIEQIEKKGEFKVQGKNEDEFTTWKLNSWIIRGEEFITNQFQKALGVAWHQAIQMKCRIAPKFARNYMFKSQLINPNILDGFMTIASIFSKILNLTFGMKKVQIFNKSQVIGQLLKERLSATIKQHHQQLRVSFFEFIWKMNNYTNKKEFDLTQNEKKVFENVVADFNIITGDFDKWATKYQSDRIKELEKSGTKSEDEALMEIFHEKQKHLFEMIRSGKYIKDQEIQTHLINLIQATQISNRNYYELNRLIREKREEVENDIIKRHPIKSRVHLWRERVVKEEAHPILEKLVVDCNQKILKELNEQNLKGEVILFVRFTEFQQARKQIYNDNYKRIQSQSTTPCRVFTTFQQYMPPFKILKKHDQYDGQVYYEYDKGKDYTTKTDFFGWRIVLQLIRYKVWTINVFINLVQNLINGQFGLKALFKTTPFPRNKYVEYRTGEEKSHGDYYPYVLIFQKTLEGIRKSISDFEALPDRGIFGKNFARIFKYIECYIFRLLFVAIFVVGILMPIAIVANCLASFFLALTSWLWIPVTLVIRWFYHLLLWDFDSPTRKSSVYYYPEYSVRYQTYETLPVIKGAVQLTLGVIEIFTSILSMLVIHPLIALLSIILAFVRRFLTTLNDKVMCSVTKKIGRQPEIDTFIAWKVRGTGVTRQYTYSIDVEDVKFLMRGFLESTELTEYQTRLVKKINGPKEIYSEISQNLFRHYGLSQSSNEYINQNINKLVNAVDEQIRKRRKIYPKLPSCNIKFTAEELSNIFEECERITKQFVQSRKMNWVFERFQVEDETDFKTLTEQFLVKVFNDSNILYPISELDKRIEIKTVKNSQFDSVSKAIGGETHLKTFVANIKPKFQKFKKTILFPFIGKQEVTFKAAQAINNDNTCTKYSDPSDVTFFFSYKQYEEATQKKDASSKKSD